MPKLPPKGRCLVFVLFPVSKPNENNACALQPEVRSYDKSSQKGKTALALQHEASIQLTVSNEPTASTSSRSETKRCRRAL